MARATRTVNPLHFEDLEPHRFEDLVRQLAYDFRDWLSLEPTGRLGADEGVDIRGTERVRMEDDDDGAEREESEEPPRMGEEREWVIQCKRERVITPQKVRAVVEQAITGRVAPYGLIVAVAADFSKKTRDAFRAESVGRGLREFYLWGKADLEDMLYRPQNDPLLFAYFGISLQVRRRSLRSRVRSILATKRKAVAILGGVDQTHFQPVLVRDAGDAHYPYKGDIKDFGQRPRWKFYTFLGHHPQGLELLAKQYFAYVADDEKHWDYYDAYDDAAPQIWDEPWTTEKEKEERGEAHQRIWHYWYHSIPERNRATLQIVRLIPYEDIIDLDKDGDIYARGVPHVFAEFRSAEDGPFKTRWSTVHLEYGETSWRKHIYPEKGMRVKFFPKRLPKTNAKAPQPDEAQSKPP